MAPQLDTILSRVTDELRESLGENLFSCCLYGSAVRGNLVEGISDLNLLIVVNVSDCEAHEKIAHVIGPESRIDPFVLGRVGFKRSVYAFAAKFASIKRNYRVLCGADPLADIEIGALLERFLCEQALRNLRLRLAFAFVTRAREKTYGRFLIRSVTPLFLRLAEVLRLDGTEVPVNFAERIPYFEKAFGIDGYVLGELLALKSAREAIPEHDASGWHRRVFPILDAAVRWIESRWETSFPGA